MLETYYIQCYAEQLVHWDMSGFRVNRFSSLLKEVGCIEYCSFMRTSVPYILDSSECHGACVPFSVPVFGLHLTKLWLEVEERQGCLSVTSASGYAILYTKYRRGHFIYSEISLVG